MAEDIFARGVRALARRDRDFRRVVKLYGPPPDRLREPGFGTLVKIVLGQQVSVAAADSIWLKLSTALGEVAPEAVLACADGHLCTFGLSRAKARYVAGMAQAVADGRLDFDLLERLDDEAAIAHLTAVKGVGRWTAEIYLLSALRRPDVWPAADLALMTAAQRLKGLPERPDAKGLLLLAEAWRPWRAVAARLLWHYYRHDRAKAAPMAVGSV